MGVTAENQVETLTGQRGHDVRGVGQEDPGSLRRDSGDRPIEIVVATGRVVDPDYPEALLELRAVVDEELALHRPKAALETADGVRRVVPVARDRPDAQGGRCEGKKLNGCADGGGVVHKVAGDEQDIGLEILNGLNRLGLHVTDGRDMQIRDLGRA